MEELDYKQLWQQCKRYLAAQYDYSKFTLAEKLAMLLSRVALVAVLLFIGFSGLMLLSAALVVGLSGVLDNTWAACLVVVAVLLVLAIVVIACRNSLIVNPVTRFITRLFLAPEQDNTGSDPKLQQ